MAKTIRGPMCSTRCGPGWVDDGTLCRSASDAPGTTGADKRKGGNQLAINHRTFLRSSISLSSGYVHGVKRSPSIQSSGPRTVEGVEKFTRAIRGNFKALVWGDKGKWTALQFMGQEFWKYATPWEKLFSPLVGNRLNKTGKPFYPVVDGLGTIMGYYSSGVDPGSLHKRGSTTRYAGPGVKPKADYRPLRGGDSAEVLLSVDGEALNVRVYDRPLEPSIGVDLLLLGVGIGVGIVRSGAKSLVLKAAARGASTRTGGGLSSWILRRSGKFAQGSGRIDVYHGLGKGARDALKKTKKLRFSGPQDDFGRAVYLTRDSRVATSFAQERGKGKIVQAQIETEQLGRIVDVRAGGVHRAAWEQYMRTPITTGGQTPAQIVTSGRAGYRGQFFDDFLKQNGLADADTVVGPLGGPWTSGPAANFVTEQIAIRSERVAAAVAEALAKSL